ncbi:MFS transporter [Paenibacillus aceti]|uniref:MFS transporter n=1 Tax=Paenibacillus aceti TaxID=1820010 RepID=A0ABQ1W1K6_9BACL|nr:MFS transporter [Paenibacillus aceti]GGG06741.1 MFS transporter [Paenibacillus aceti]
MAKAMNNSNWRKWLILVLLGIAGSLIYKLPYLRETYYAAMQEATGATNAQLGLLMSAYGLINFILYLPGGWAADRFSARNLLTFSLVSTGLTGFYYATFPSYFMIVLLHALWAVTTVFTFWAVCVRIIRELGDSSEQGKLYGFWYLGKGLTSMIVGFISVPIFMKFGEGVGGLRATIIFYSIVTILTGIACWFFIDSDKKDGEKSNFKVADMKEVLRMPAMWMAGIVTFCMWSIYIGFGMVTPYLSDVFNMSESNVALASIMRAYVLFGVGGLLGGYIADKCKSRTRFMIYAFIGMIIFTIVYIVLPGEAGRVGLALTNMVALGSFIYCANAVFFSIIDEVNIPNRLTGTAAGLMSLLTYFPEIYLYTTVGNMVDRTPGIGGYRHVFLFMLGCAVVGLIASFILQNMNKKAKLKKSAGVDEAAASVN